MKTKLALLSLGIFCAFSAGAESTIYLFDEFPYAQIESVKFNGKDISLPEKEIVGEQKMPLPDGSTKIFEKHRKCVSEYVVKNDGEITVTRDFSWYDKPYNDEVTLTLNDGDVVYIKLVSGMKSELKVMKEKDGRKLLEKAKKSSKDWDVKSGIVFE